MTVDPRVASLLGGPKLARLRRRLRQRFERAAIESTVTNFRIDRLNEAEYEALAGLQGLPVRRATSILVGVARIDMALGNAGLAHSLKDALEQLDGDIVHRPTARQRTAAQWSRVLASCTHSGPATTLESATAQSLLKRLSKQNPGTASELILSASAVLGRLPAAGVPRALLAAETLGDPHALGKGRPVATLVLTVLRRSLELPPGREQARPRQDETVRGAWAKAGVLVNELARPALFLNLPNSGNAGRAGEPAYLSLRSLLRAAPQWDVAAREVFVCENPNLLAIVADRLGPTSAPLVCTDGMPSAAQQVRLTQLSRAGAILRYHGDFDWPGLRIGNTC